MSSKPPSWASDPLSAYLDSFATNQHACFVHLPELYRYLVEVDRVFRALLSNLDETPEWFASFFARRSLSAFLAASALALGGAVAEVYPVLRSCLEQALYGLHISADPERGNLWLNRHAGPSSKGQLVRTFRTGALIATVGERDKPLSVSVSEIYEDLIDRGAHPNERGLMTTSAIEQDESRIRLSVTFLTGDSPVYRVALINTCRVGVASIALCRLIFPEPFERLGLKDSFLALRKRAAV